MIILVSIVAVMGFLVGFNIEHQNLVKEQHKTTQYVKQLQHKNRQIQRLIRKKQSTLKMNGVVIKGLEGKFSE